MSGCTAKPIDPLVDRWQCAEVSYSSSRCSRLVAPSINFLDGRIPLRRCGKVVLSNAKEQSLNGHKQEHSIFQEAKMRSRWQPTAPSTRTRQKRLLGSSFAERAQCTYNMVGQISTQSTDVQVKRLLTSTRRVPVPRVCHEQETSTILWLCPLDYTTNEVR